MTVDQALFSQDSRVLLWPHGAPQALGQSPEDQPSLTVHLPSAESNTGAAIVVCPGGGYRILAADHEGLQIARWLNQIGIAAFVLRYRVAPAYHSEVSLLDGSRAVRFVRAHAGTMGIASNRIGILGFSAGGHLTTAVGTRYQKANPRAEDPIDRVSCRPDFMVPVYAVTNGAARGRKADEYTPTDEKVTSDTPPAFIVHSHEDSIVPASQSTLFYNALLLAGVQAELHIFGRGEHGMGLGVGDPNFKRWPGQLHDWLRACGFLTDAERIAVSGRVTLNGKAMGIAWISLIPEDPSAPIANIRLNRAGNGEFEIDAAHGPVPGSHRAEVFYLSDEYPHTASGLYTLDDRRRFECSVEVRPGEKLVVDVCS